jgi:hypothetical protein
MTHHASTREQLAWMDRGMCVAAGIHRWQQMSADQQEQVCRGCPVADPCARWLRHKQPLHRPVYLPTPARY